jgi:hypothetical protein
MRDASYYLFGIMMKRSRKTALAIGALLVLVLAGLTTAVVLGPPGPHFVCHRLLDGALEQWMLETTNGVTFPNVDGSSSQSLRLVLPYLGLNDTNALRDYMYVPGLRSDDPDNLILFYLREPSRRTWHGDTHWFSGPKRWVVLNPRMSSPDSDSARAGGELCEAISSAEFKDRLRATIDYLKQNKRPNWEAAEQEHMRFISSIQE